MSTCQGTKQALILVHIFNSSALLPLLCCLMWCMHKFNCLRDANCLHIGVTTRHLATRAPEHLHFTTKKTAITEHQKVRDDCKKNSDINLLNIIRKCNTEYETKIHEALQIKKIKRQFNTQLHANPLRFC